jgi:hypothetical protein
VKNFALGLFLLCAISTFAQISQWQPPVSLWNTAPSSSCAKQFTTTSQAKDLFVVWTFWTSSTQITASVADSSTYHNTFYSAVGPTIQPASGTPIYSQIFYAKSIHLGTGNDTIQVTYSGPASISGCVFVEYQGADTMFPLDSVSAGYSPSGSPTNLMDSGTVSPANANLLVFAGGTSDSGTAVAGTNLSGIQNNGGSIVEENTNPISGNGALQRATASITIATTGNWLMQMAVFRDASSTVSGGWSPTRLPQYVNAAQYPGAERPRQS